MRGMQVQFTPTPDEDIAAAILAALTSYIEPGAPDEPGAAASSAWRAAGVLAAQGLPTARGAGAATWSTAERAGRAGRWSQGIVGI